MELRNANLRLDLDTGEISSDREKELEKLPEKFGESLEEVKERFLNEVGYREALHTAHLLGENVYNYLVEHPCIIFDEKSFWLANIAAMVLFELYQRIGQLDYELSEQED